MTQEVGRLHQEKQSIENQIADLFAFYSKQAKNGSIPVSGSKPLFALVRINRNPRSSSLGQFLLLNRPSQITLPRKEVAVLEVFERRNQAPSVAGEPDPDIGLLDVSSSHTRLTY